MNILQFLAKSRFQDISEIKAAISIRKHLLKRFGENSTKTKISKIQYPAYNELVLGNNRTTLSTILSKQSHIQIISELKPASPTLGRILPDTILNSVSPSCKGCDSNIILTPTLNDFSTPVGGMLQGGVCGISVLTEPRRFHGSYGNVVSVNRILPQNIPLLLKDFIVDESQIELGHLCGASNGLLIAKLDHLDTLFDAMNKYSMEPLIEIHDLADLERVKQFQNSDSPFVLGINNRNLTNLEIDFQASRKLIPQARQIFGKHQVIITESGIDSYKQLCMLRQFGAQAALIGSSIMQNGRISQKIRELKGESDPFIKICGITSPETFDNCPISQISAFGVVVGVPQSSRNLSEKDAILLFNQAPSHLKRVIVTKNKSLEEILALFSMFHPDYMQYHGDNKFEILRALPQRYLPQMIVPVASDNDHLRDAYREIIQIPNQVFAILLDSSEGHGSPLDIKTAEKVMAMFPHRQIILAGGIGAHNVGLIISHLRPFGIDASSALEESGQKNLDKIKLFCLKANQASQSNQINSNDKAKFIKKTDEAIEVDHLPLK